ncbi:alpha-glucosidase [Siphonobacter sp. SORGH_AS_0500]|uniref:glycoside hydrolase family 97 protein n=1 Tax=Siphonobacter sp. SORGH_AS_0500 TaxID=1864824 RepID=UPI000CC7DF17|nr:glycoside hydrolase family 97 protein [Siphonobacter sp. SORGH_AS_0500]PKK36184.1 alpha-glucosidase [Siphonobacter sp. SORGH_AS_0500]
MKITSLVILLGLFSYLAPAQVPAAFVASPDKHLSVKVTLKDGSARYQIFKDNQPVLESSALGLVLADVDLSKHLKEVAKSPEKTITQDYAMRNAKKSTIHYQAKQRSWLLATPTGEQLEIIFQVSNDAVAFRYRVKRKKEAISNVESESTSFAFPAQTRAWLQPMAVAKTGWEATNPSYEEDYEQDIAVGTPSKMGAGWVYPALFKTNETWVLITEADLDNTYCATRLQDKSPGGEYFIGFPDAREVIKDKNLNPRARGTFQSPWRVLTIGSLANLIESTAGTDLALPALKVDAAFIKPGRASWSWINSKDDFIVYDEQKKYIDFAAYMHWPYCLIDADWDRKIGYEKVQELAQYAKTKNVGLLLWYNSAGDWNTVKYTPKGKLVEDQSRRDEFARLEKMGIKGVKIDFFGGDGQSVIKYYHDILLDAAKYHLLVNFHGATLPRGWARTYPHLMTTEAVKGFEMVTFDQKAADNQPTHAAMLPFTRNAFDPMDFTPMNLYKIYTSVKRKTTSAFELATSIVFLSGIQHYAESPEGMEHVPAFAQDFLRQLPNHWDEVKFIDGYPGKLCVVARRSGKRWYVAGINGEAKEKQLKLNLSFLAKTKATLITDGEPMFTQQSITPSQATLVTVKANGGFVLVTE